MLVSEAKMKVFVMCEYVYVLTISIINDRGQSPYTVGTRSELMPYRRWGDLTNQMKGAFQWRLHVENIEAVNQFVNHKPKNIRPKSIKKKKKEKEMKLSKCTQTCVMKGKCACVYISAKYYIASSMFCNAFKLKYPVSWRWKHVQFYLRH